MTGCMLRDVISRVVGVCVSLATEATTALRSVLLASLVPVVASHVTVCWQGGHVTLCQEFVWMIVPLVGWEAPVISVGANCLFSFHQTTWSSMSSNK